MFYVTRKCAKIIIKVNEYICSCGSRYLLEKRFVAHIKYQMSKDRLLHKLLNTNQICVNEDIFRGLTTVQKTMIEVIKNEVL